MSNVSTVLHCRLHLSAAEPSFALTVRALRPVSPSVGHLNTRNMTRDVVPIITVFLLLLTAPVSAGSLYSYINERGVRVYTNIGVNRTDLPGQNTRPARKDATNPYLPLIDESAQRFNLDADLVRAVIQIESHFDSRAVSSKGCIGLMQLHPDTAKRFGVTDAYDPAQNIRGGVQYLRFLTDHFKGKLPLVLAAYNAGENAVIRHQGIPPYRETQEYVRKVTTLYESFKPASDPTGPNQELTRVVLPNGSVLFTSDGN